VKVNLVNVLMLGTVVILLYSGIKGYDPRDVISYGLGGKKPKTMKQKEEEGGKIETDPRKNPDPGQQHPGDRFYPPDPTVPASTSV
jgi:hypothetical protein